MAAIVTFSSLGGDADLEIHLNDISENNEDYQNEPNVVWRVLVVAYEVVKEVAEKAIFRSQLLLSPAESLPWIDALKFAESCNRVSNKPLGIEDRRQLARAVEVVVRAELAATSKKARACTRCHHSLFHLRCPTCTTSDHGLTSIPPLGRPVPLPMGSPTPIHPTTATIDALNNAAQCAALVVARKQTPRTLQHAVEVAVAVVDNSRLGDGNLPAARSDASMAGRPRTAPRPIYPPATPFRGAGVLTPHTEEPSLATGDTLSEPSASVAGASPSRCSSCSSLSTDIDLNAVITDESDTDDSDNLLTSTSRPSPAAPPAAPRIKPPPVAAAATTFVPPIVPTLNLASATTPAARGTIDPEPGLQGPLTPAQSVAPPPNPPADADAAAFDRNGSAHSTASVVPDPASPRGHPKKPHLAPVDEIEPASPTFVTAATTATTTTTDDASYGSASSPSSSTTCAVTIAPFHAVPQAPPAPSAAPSAAPPAAFQLHVPASSSKRGAVRIEVQRHDPPAASSTPATPAAAGSSRASASAGPSTPHLPAAPPLNSHALDFDDAYNVLSSYFGEVFRTAASRSAADVTFDSRPSSSTMQTACEEPSSPTAAAAAAPPAAPAPAAPTRSRLGRAASGTTPPQQRQQRNDGEAVRDARSTPAAGPPAARRLGDLPAPLGPTTPRFETPRYEVVKVNPYARISGGSGAAEALEQLQAAQHAAAAAAALPERLRSGAAPSQALHGEGLDLLPSACAAYSAARDARGPAAAAAPPPPAPAPGGPVLRRHSAPVPAGLGAAAPGATPAAAAALLAAAGGRTPVTPGRPLAEMWADTPLLEGMGSSPVNNARTPKMLRHASQPVMAEIQEEPGSSVADQAPLRTVTRQRASPSYHSFGIQLGQGSFGTVQKGLWRGRMVAIKTICVQGADVRGQEHAMREAAITYSLDHPNIIKTYSWDVQVADSNSPRPMTTAGALTPRTPRAPTPSTSASSGSTAPSDWIVSMVVELCDADLVQALRASCFHTPDKRPILPSILQIALDIARGMEHLHTRRIIHGDLKSTNVLLKHHRSAASGFMAKVADLGMAYKLPRGSTEILGVHSGTRGYIAPEVQHEGTISQASDVYSFGVVLWELYHAKPAVASRAFPTFQRGCPRQLEELARSCLGRAPAQRPTFGGVMLQLCALIESMARPARQQPRAVAASHRAA